MQRSHRLHLIPGLFDLANMSYTPDMPAGQDIWVPVFLLITAMVSYLCQTSNRKSQGQRQMIPPRTVTPRRGTVLRN